MIRHGQHDQGAVFLTADPETLRFVSLDAMTLIYHRPSGITHVLASPVPELLDALAEPRDLNGLLEYLASQYELVDADRDALTERIWELEAAGLVRRA